MIINLTSRNEYLEIILNWPVETIQEEINGLNLVFLKSLYVLEPYELGILLKNILLFGEQHQF